VDEMKTTRLFIKYCILSRIPLRTALKNQGTVCSMYSYQLFELQENKKKFLNQVRKTIKQQMPRYIKWKIIEGVNKMKKPNPWIFIPVLLGVLSFALLIISTILWLIRLFGQSLL
jgi:hypothetical protein